MLPILNLGALRFAEPLRLWLLVVPAVLLAMWAWQFSRRRGDVNRLTHRELPGRERFRYFGGFLFWLCVILATSSVVVALAMPVRRGTVVRTAAVDVIVLQDGSASMRTKDVTGDRWQRSIRFLRVLTDGLDWENGDRIAMALFAHIATPEVRLTKDPNTFFFFLDSLSAESPFRLEDDTTWDTNIELGIRWGMRLLEKDEEIHGRSPNSKVFVLISDGQSWSGEVAAALALARRREMPVFVVGVGTTTGGPIPVPPPKPGWPYEFDGPPILATLDRASLEAIATSGAGRYFELDREGDRQIVNTIIGSARRRGGSRGVEEGSEDVHWNFLFAAACLVAAGGVFLHERGELWMHLAGAGATLLALWSVVR